MNEKEITRLEIINEQGRQYVNMDCAVELHIQDNGKTLKIFVSSNSKDKMVVNTNIEKLTEKMEVFKK